MPQRFSELLSIALINAGYYMKLLTNKHKNNEIIKNLTNIVRYQRSASSY